MNLALIICLIGGIIYLATGMSGKYPDIGELGRLSFWCGLLSYLLK